MYIWIAWCNCLWLGSSDAPHFNFLHIPRKKRGMVLPPCLFFDLAFNSPVFGLVIIPLAMSYQHIFKERSKE